jgi:hypothetical protein
MRGPDVTDLATDDPGATQVVDLGELDLRDVDVSRDAPTAGPRRTAPPPLPVAAPPVVTSAVMAPAPPPGRSTRFYVGILIACLVVSLVAGFVIASGLRRAEPKAAPTPSAAPSAAPRVITISPVEVD